MYVFYNYMFQERYHAPLTVREQLVSEARIDVDNYRLTLNINLFNERIIEETIKLSENNG